ncbi:MAG: DEAD/DEAH box helicase [archaeon]
MKKNIAKLDLPFWLAEKNNVPSIMYGYIKKETEKAVLFKGTPVLMHSSKCFYCNKTIKNDLGKAIGVRPGSFEKMKILKKEKFYLLDVENLKKIQKRFIENPYELWIPKEINQKHKKRQTVFKNVTDSSIFKKLQIDLNEFNIAKEIPNMTVNHYLDVYTRGDEKYIKIVFDFNNNLIQRVQLLPEKEFLYNENIWITPLLPANYKRLKWLFNGFAVSDELKKEIGNKEKDLKLSYSKKGKGKLAILNFKNKGKLRPFQEAGVEYIDKKNGRALLADDMGLGKTIQAIGYLQLHPELRPAVIIPPAILKINWRDEIEKWLSKNNKVEVLEGVKKQKLSKADIYICNYTILKDRVEQLLEIKPQVIILDEAHKIKNKKTKQSKSVKKLASALVGEKKIIAITGTPILNRVEELYNLLSLVRPDLYPDNYKGFRQFAYAYCGAEMKSFGLDSKGSSNLDLLNEKLRNTLMVRRKKDEVLKELPPKTRIVQKVSIKNRKEYAFAEKDFINYLKTIDIEKAKKAQRAETLTKINYLKQLASEGKRKDIYSWIDNFLESSNEKLIIFAHYQDTIKAIHEKYKENSVMVYGGNKNSRQESIDSFKENKNTRIFIGNLKAAGVGLTLTESSTVLTIEMGWTPGDHEQAEDRAHRISQIKKVFCYYLLAEKTIEEDIYSLVDQKRNVINKAVGDGVVKDFEDFNEEDLLTEILNIYQNKKTS